MKTISLLQPWATLVVMGLKKIETRSWDTKYRGPLLIHASKSREMGMPRMNQDYFLGEVYNKLAREAPAFVDLPFGAIIGKVELKGTSTTDFYLQCKERGIPIADEGGDWEKEIAFGDYSPGRYGWLLSNPVQFKEPIPYLGSLGLWEYKGQLP